MKAIIIDTEANKAVIYSCKSEIGRLLNKSTSTLLNWSKKGIHRHKQYIICFDVEERKNKRLRRNNAF